MTHILVIMACHNRAEKTEKVLSALSQISLESKASIGIYAVDDGSHDGTYEVLVQSPLAESVILGDGKYYWAKSMAIAERAALGEVQRIDANQWILWLNDDVELDVQETTKVFDSLEVSDTVFVGEFRDSEGLTTYSGFRRYGRHPMHLEKVRANGSTQDCDTINGNFVLVPANVAIRVGGIEGRYGHALADIDYGMRLRKLGFEIKLLPNLMGFCALNPLVTRPFVADLRYFLSVKGGGHPKSLLMFYWRFSGLAMAYYVPRTYIVWFLRRVISAVNHA